MVLRRVSLPATKVHYLLSNPRRRHALEYLKSTTGPVSLRELSEVVSQLETEQVPAPRNVRENVYISLHQNHLPTLEAQGIVEYDRERRQVTPLERARDVRVYMEVVTRYGITWSDYYRNLGVLGLFVVVASLVGVPLVSTVDPLLWASGFLAVFGLSTVYQLWKARFGFIRGLRLRFGGS